MVCIYAENTVDVLSLITVYGWWLAHFKLFNNVVQIPYYLYVIFTTEYYDWG